MGGEVRNKKEGNERQRRDTAAGKEGGTKTQEERKEGREERLAIE